MKIVHINLSLSWRGGERQVFLLMQGLREQKIDQILICRKKSVLEKRCKQLGIPYHSISKNPLSLPQVARFARNLERDGFNVIHCHESDGHTVAVLAKILWNSKQKIVLHRRVIFPVKKKITTSIKYSEKHISKIICISRAVEAVIKESIDFKQTVVIPSMVPVQKCLKSRNLLQENFGIPRGRIIGYIAALTYEKDHKTFLETAKILLEKSLKNLHFVIIGEGHLKKEMTQYTKILGIENRVTFTGFIENIHEIIPEIDILLFTSTSEGLGSTILDFFAARKPVVCVKNGGSEELVFDGKTGFLCEKEDKQCLSDRVQFLLENEKMKTQITEQAYQMVRETFSIQNITSKTIELYRSL